MPSLALAARVRPDNILPEILPALIVLFLLIIAGTVVLTVLRRSIRRKDDDSPDGFTLHGLRELHARGDLSDEEFERAKAAVIERARGDASRNAVEPASAPASAADDSADSAEESDTNHPAGPPTGDAPRTGDDSPDSRSNL